MASVIEELYHGNIGADIRIYPQDSAFVQAAQVKHENSEKLMEALDDAGKEIFEKYCEAECDIDDITRYDTFTYALKLGILLMTEVFTGQAEIAGGGDC